MFGLAEGALYHIQAAIFVFPLSVSEHFLHGIAWNCKYIKASSEQKQAISQLCWLSLACGHGDQVGQSALGQVFF
jgi:hypothetical protein